MVDNLWFSNINWIVLAKSIRFLDLATNLTCGQAFRWRLLPNSTIVGLFKHRVWQLKQEERTISYRVLACPHWKFNEKIQKRHFTLTEDEKKFTTLPRKCECITAETSLISNYLQLNTVVEKLNKQWIKNDKNFKRLSAKQLGIRVLKQDPTETLFSFLCSANNSISRIVPMIEKMCKQYGEKLVEIGPHEFYDFPSLNALVESGNESDLRKLGFGYRANYIVSCAHKVMSKGGDDWLNSLKDLSYEEAVSQLLELPGVGMKVADCVCLMSLDKAEAVPIDTHVRQIAVRDYDYHLKSKSLTHNAYKELGCFFRTLWGSHAGWAQAVLFVADTKPLPKLYELKFDTEPKKTKVIIKEDFSDRAK